MTEGFGATGAPTPATPTATRLGRPRWRDTRLLVGVLLVLLSVVLGAKVVAEADDTVSVWAVTTDLAPDSVLTAEDLRRVAVRLDDSLGSYVRADGDVPVGYVVRRDLRPGELLPAAAIARDDLADRRRVTVTVDEAVAKGLRRNAVVDVYVVPDDTPGAKSPRAARLVLERVTVARDPAGDRGLGGGRGQTGVELMVPGGSVRELLTALAGGVPALVEVPTAGAAGGEAGS